MLHFGLETAKLFAMNRTIKSLTGSPLIVLVLFVAPGLARAKMVEEVIKVPVEVVNVYGKTAQHDILVTLFYDDRTPAPRPVLLLNHGRAPEAPARAALGRVKYTSNSKWFAGFGFLVAVPTRLGYGETGGEDVEDSGACNAKQYEGVYEAAVRQTRSVLDTLRQRPEVSKDRAIVVGQSFGGTTAVAVAAQNLAGVQGAINFAGGGGGNPKTRAQDPCGSAQLKRLFANYGKSARTPMLWIYSENDMYFGPKLPREWFEAFQASGGAGEFAQFPPHTDDGHSLFTRGPELWHPKVTEFLQRVGYSPLIKP